MKAIQTVWTFLLFLFFFAASASAADVAKIGVVDFQRVIKESEAGRHMQTQIQKKGRQMEADLQELAQQIEKLNEQLTRDAMVMSKEKRQEKQRELEIKKYDFQSTQKEYQAKFRELENKMLEKLREEIFAIAEQIGKKEGYLLIIEKSAAIYYPGTIDITDKIIRQYNESFTPASDSP